MCKLPWQWNMKWNLTFYFEIDDKVLEVRILDNSFFIDNILYSFTQVAALILPLQVPDDQISPVHLVLAGHARHLPHHVPSIKHKVILGAFGKPQSKLLELVVRLINQGITDCLKIQSILDSHFHACVYIFVSVPDILAFCSPCDTRERETCNQRLKRDFWEWKVDQNLTLRV